MEELTTLEVDIKRTVKTKVTITIPSYIIDLDGGGIFVYKLISKEKAIQVLNSGSSAGITLVGSNLAFSSGDFDLITEEQFNEKFEQAINKFKELGKQ